MKRRWIGMFAAVILLVGAMAGPAAADPPALVATPPTVSEGEKAKVMADLEARHKEGLDRSLRQVETQLRASHLSRRGPDSSTGDVSILSYTIPIGTNQNMTAADQGNSSCTRYFFANCTVSHDLTNRRNLVGMWANTGGNADGFAWTGADFYVSGSGSRTAQLDFSGYSGYNFQTGLGSASYQVIIRIWDHTSQSWVASATPINDSKCCLGFGTTKKNWANSLQLTLQAGRWYTAVVHSYGTAGETSPGMTTVMESGNVGSQLYTEWSSINLQWL
jgi:hypothetical protein